METKESKKMAKSLLITQLCPTLNIQDRSVPLKLFNYLHSFDMC